MAASIPIEEHSGTYAGDRPAHNGYFAGDFSSRAAGPAQLPSTMRTATNAGNGVPRLQA